MSANVTPRATITKAIEALADQLHRAGVFGEPECYCRRIGTVDGTRDGPLDSGPGGGFTEDWGFQDKPECEAIATAILAALEPIGWTLMNVDRLLEQTGLLYAEIGRLRAAILACCDHQPGSGCPAADIRAALTPGGTDGQR